VILLVWMYYSAQLFFLGAEFTKVYAAMYGSHPGPAAAARPANLPAETEGQS
jgi:membrane protein